MNNCETIASSSGWSRAFVVFVGILATNLIFFGQSADADGKNDPVADNFAVSFYRVSSPQIGELDSNRSTFQQAMVDVERLLSWTNGFDGSLIVDRVEVEWDEVVNELEGGKIVKNTYKVKRTFGPKPKPRSPRPSSTPTETQVESNPTSVIPSLRSQDGSAKVRPAPPRVGNIPGGVSSLDPDFFERMGSGTGRDGSTASSNGRTVRLKPSSIPYSGPRIRVFNGSTGELIQQYNYDANGNRDSGRPVADGKPRSDREQLIMDDSQPKNKPRTGVTTFSYDNNAKKSVGDPNDPRIKRQAELKRQGEEIAAEKTSIQSERDRLKREQADLDRENRELSQQSSQMDQAQRELDRLQRQLVQSRRQIEQLQDQYEDYAEGGWKRGYNLCPDGSTYDGCTAHPASRQRWYRYAQGEMSRMRSKLTELKLWIPSTELQVNQQRGTVDDLQSRLSEARRRTDLDFRQHSTSVEKLNGRQSAWEQKANTYLGEVQALQSNGP